MAMEKRFFNAWADTVTGLNHLPHWDQAGASYFLTIHLGDSLPVALVEQWRIERDKWLGANPPPWNDEQEARYHSRFSAAKEAWLDEGHGECLLRRRELREAMEKVITLFDRDRYWHHAWVIMPNHAHFLFSMKEGIALSDLAKAWKGTSSREIGRILRRRMTDDPLWQKDYFDRMIRDTPHFWNCARYIQRNPTKAKLRENDYTLYLSEEVQTALK